MPARWSDKDERQYEHIRESETRRGRNEGNAEEIAARTVNKRRRREGRTAKRRTSGIGNPKLGYEERSRDEFYNRARELGIRGRGGMSKDELVAALRGW